MGLYIALYSGYYRLPDDLKGVHGFFIFEARNYGEAKTRANKNLSNDRTMRTIFYESWPDAQKYGSLDSRESRLVSLKKLENVLGVTGAGNIVRSPDHDV